LKVYIYDMYTYNALINDHNSTKTDPDTVIFPWSDMLELFIMNQLSSMYTTCEERHIDFQTAVHYCGDIWGDVFVENPLKEHIKRFNTSARNLNKR